MTFRMVALSVIVGFMLAETRVSRANVRGLRAAGAIEPPGDAYLALALLYPTAFVAMGVEGVWRALQDGAAPAAPGPSWAASGVLLFAASKALKYWAIRALGVRWSFRVMVLPGAPLVENGPYRYVSHPNYIAVVGELVGAAMMMEARVLGPIMTAAFGVALWARIRFESRVLAPLRQDRSGSTLGEQR
jgi:methyltransferase